jgi:hypothetical protein
MPIDRVPPYLIDGVRLSNPERIQEALETGDAGQLLDSALQASQLLEEWAEDSEFWDSASDALADDLPDADFDDYRDEEREIIATSLDGDYKLANAILVELPSPSAQRRPNPEQAREIVLILRTECHAATSEPPKRAKWRTARVLRRVFKAFGGGLAIAADIVAPDPTFIVKVASVWGGVDLILDAADIG